MRLHIRLVSGADGETVDHWEVQGGSKRAKATKGQTEGCGCGGGDASGDAGADRARASLHRMRRCTRASCVWEETFEMAKMIVKHLRDPSAPYVAPC